MVLLEAFAHGLPVLAPRLGSLAELVEPGRIGWHFAPGDVADLRRAVQTILAEPGRLPDLSAAARRHYLDVYTPAENLRRLEAIYREASAAPAPR